MHKWHFLTQILKADHISLHWGTIADPSALHMGVIVNSKSPRKKHKNVKNATLSRPQKRLLFIGWMLNQKAAQLGTCICVGHLKFFAIQHMSTNDYKSIVSIELGLTINSDELAPSQIL